MAGPTFAIAKSATGVTVVVTGSVTLFVGIGSPVGEPPVATFVIEPEAGAVTGSSFKVEWPPGSGRMRNFPEVDRAQFFPQAEALAKIKSTQRPFIERLAAVLGLDS